MNPNDRVAPAALVAALVLSFAASSALAGPSPRKSPPAPKKAASATAAEPRQYECGKCHMRVSAAVAKKDGYRDPMDGGKFAPAKPAARRKAR